MKFLVICDYRENCKNYAANSQHNTYNDHPSRKNIEEIISAVRSLGHECEYFGGIPELIHAIDTGKTFPDCLFLNFTDGLDENYSRVQAPALLDMLKVPYSGSDVFPSALMNNKHFCKQALRDYAVTMPKSLLVSHCMPLNPADFSDWRFPLFVKPNCEGSSLGISQKSVCHSMEDAQKICSDLLENFSEIIIEEYVSGIDVTDYLIGNSKIYAINDVITAQLFDASPYAVYGSTEKEKKLRTLFFNEEYLPSKIVHEIQMQSARIAEILNARDICRIDYRVNLQTKEICFIEANSAPRFSSTSEIGFIAQKRQLSFSQMVNYYITAFLNRIS